RTNTSHKLRISEGHAGLTFERRRSRAGPGGGAQPCQGWGRGFESHRPLQNLKHINNFSAYWTLGSPSFWLRKHVGSTAIPILPPLRMSPCKQNKAGLRIAAKA